MTTTRGEMKQHIGRAQTATRSAAEHILPLVETYPDYPLFVDSAKSIAGALVEISVAIESLREHLP